LGTPAGSILLGSKAFIKEARRVRKVMGGGMRQAGFLAAAGIYALDNNIARLKEDHLHAHELWECLKTLPQVVLAVEPETNILIFDLESEQKKLETIGVLEKKGIKAISFGKKRIRMVTHLDVLPEHIESIKSTLKETLG
jgi:threonine aldolase